MYIHLKCARCQEPRDRSRRNQTGASRFSGGRTDREIIITFLISGLCSSMVGPMISGQINRIWSTQGAGYELAAIYIAVLGGASLTGGKGTMAGTFIAALIFGGLMNLLNLSGVGTYLQDVVKVMVIVHRQMTPQRPSQQTQHQLLMLEQYKMCLLVQW